MGDISIDNLDNVIGEPGGDGYPAPWDESFVIPSMPVPVWRDWPPDWKEWSKEKRQAHIKAENPGRLALEALALWNFAHWLLENVEGSDLLGAEDEDY